MLKVLKTAKIFVLALLIICVISLSFAVGGFSTSKGFQPGTLLAPVTKKIPSEFDLLGEAWNILSEHYVDERALVPKKLSIGAIEGLIKSLNDPHTSYLDPETNKLGKTSFRGAYEGIGATVTIKDEILMIITPIVGSPAEKAGIKAEDIILEINGEPTTKMGLGEAVSKIRGPRGTSVRLIVLHKGSSSPIEIEVVRDEIKTPSVFSKMLPEGIAYIWITYFSQRTPNELILVLEDILDEEAKAIVLDLRGNPGGILESAVDATSQFLKEGIVCYEVSREGERKAWKVKKGGLATDITIAVLVNQSSASGSEIVAGALQDSGRAIILGSKTHGKGSINQLYELSDGSAIYVTTGRWLTPNGNLIEDKGITPDIEVELTEDDIEKEIDSQLQRAIEYLKTQLLKKDYSSR